ncbi:hypothetical protein ACU635_50805 [[Actinomadura] parvosata]|uniref:hypothetical protein n=1 Tax=[Actinomadura] parvosata TaxID=1955412 RepID=UPI00406C4541
MIRRVTMTMTVLGLIADWAYLHLYVASLFMGIGEWGFGLVWAAMGGVYVWWLTTSGWRRAKAVLAEARGADR